MEFRRIREIKESVKSEKEKLSDTQYWLKFLQTSSYHYKHSFDDQIMINLQNPQFTACSDARSWRSLSREPQGHGVPTLHNGKIRYLFDITQTSAPEGTPLPWVWEINDSQLNIDYSESVSKHLTDKYNLDSETLEEQLYDITLMRTAKYLNDDKSDLYKVVAESAAYSILYRCCPGEAQPSPKNLTGLSKYPIEEIGQAVTEISRSIFLEIESIVRNTRHNAIEEIRRNEHNETRENDRRSETRSKSQDRGISSGYGNLKGMDVRSGRGEFPVLSDLSEGSSYRSDIGSGKERISGDGSGIGKTIGGGKRDSGIHGSGVRHSTGRNERELLQDGIGVLETDSGGTSSGDPSREVRNNAQELSSQSGHQGIYMAEKQRSTEQTSDSRQSSGTRDGRYDSGKTQGEQSGIQRSGESGRLPENSTASEQFSENSRGRNSDRTDIQIIGNTPYRYIPQKTYRKYDTDIAAKIADKLGESGIKFSGKIAGETTTITVSKADIKRLEEIAHSFTAEKEKFAIGESHKQSHEVQLSRAEFIEYATDKLINDITVRNAHENSDLENFNNEINKSISELFTELIVGKEQIENYTINEIAPLYDEFQSDEAFRIDICNVISENVDISLTQLEITRDKAKELGIPFQVNEIVELPKKENPMDKAIRLINEYCEKEFGSPGNFSNMDHIELAYKPDKETGLAGIEAYADLETFRIVKEQDGRVVDEQLFNSLDHMNTVLKNLDFDKLIELPDNDKSEIKTTVFENTEKKSPDVSELSVGDVILYDGKRRKVKVGAGKTYEMIAAAMEGKRLGLHNKSLLAVPNHMTEQFANDFLTLYPNANILIAHEDDFKKENRQKLCAKIATGEFDAIIIGHSQLIKIPVSKEREEQFIKDQINELINDIAEMKEQNAESFTVKDMERTKRDYEAKLKKLIEKPIKDDVVTFEEMGVDKLFIDEADMFKNLSVSTKMRNISGVAANRKVQKTQDLYIKCQYLDELTGGKGIVFATGTPVSNSITELFIMQKYLQADYLRESGLTHFDAWAANFAQKVTKLEYAPTGKGFRQKTRLSKFSNLPELMTAFKECADIKTAQDLNLPEPECERHIIAAEPTVTQKNLIQSLSERAEKIHNKQVTPDVDNMLKVTTDGIKIGLDQRLINPLLPDEPNTKINMCVNNVTDIWKKTADERLTQVIFCDYSTPKKDAFNLYDDVKSKLIANGIPENEIAFIHDYEKPQDKERLFDKVRNGEIRIVLGSTQKMGAGTNIQNKLYAMHHLDAPWKPRDMEQRLGRMKRQGNMNDKVHEYIYVTKDTFDAYRFQTLETKQGFISQIMTSKNPVRVCEDVSQSEMEFAEVKALCSGNPLIREKMEIDIEVHKLQTLKSAYLNQRYKLEDNVLKHIPESIAKAKENLNAVLADSKITEQNPLKRDGEGNVIFSGMTINDHVYADKKEAGTALIEAAAKALTGSPNARTEIGQYRGFRLDVFFDALSNDIKMDIKGNGSYRITLSSSDTGNLTRIDNTINHIPEKIDEYKSEIEALNTQLENSKAELAKPFLKEQELKTKLARQSELDRQLNLDNKENLLGKDNVKSFELETEADRQKLNSHNSMQKKDIKSYDLEL